MMPASLSQAYCVADFLAFGEHHGIAYRFPGLPAQGTRDDTRQAVVRGRVEEIELGHGLRLTNSDLEILRPYESSSLRPVPLFLSVVLDGAIRIRLGERERWLHGGMALSARLDDALSLHVAQAPGQHLRTLNLALEPERFESPLLGDPALATLLTPQSGEVHLWRLPDHLLTAAVAALDIQADGPRRLMLEGLALQLLGHGLLHRDASAPTPCHASLSPAEWQRLDAVRRLLHDDPARPHQLRELASLAAMSPSSLRSKFQDAFGQTLFDYLRDRRLALAREYLQQGFSVQETAHFVGYRHATNFATAFRRRYGVPPSAMEGGSPL